MFSLDKEIPKGSEHRISKTLKDERIKYFLSLRDEKKNNLFNDPGKGILYLYLLHNIDYSFNIAKNFEEAKGKKWNIPGTGYLTSPAKVSSILKEMLHDGMVEISHTQKGKNRKERIYYKVSIDPLINVLLYEDMLNTIYNFPMRPCFSGFVEVACWVDSSIYFVNKCSKNALESIAVLGDIFRGGLTNMKNTILAYIADILMYLYYILDMRQGENEGEEEDNISTSYKGALDLNGLKKMDIKIKSYQDFFLQRYTSTFYHPQEELWNLLAGFFLKTILDSSINPIQKNRFYEISMTPHMKLE